MTENIGTMAPESVNLRGVQLYPFESVEELIAFADKRSGILVALNAEKIANMREPLLSIVNSNIGYADGVGAVMAARQKGANPQRIAGCDLWLKIIERYHDSKSFYLVGAKSDVIEDVVQRLRNEYPDIKIVGYRDGYLKNEQERKALIDDIANTCPDFVFVAMGSPTQELLMAEMLDRHQAVYQGLGGSFDVYAGRVSRAPEWWQNHNLEFLYRLLAQPKRWRRNLVYFKYAWWLLWKRF